MLSVEQLSLKFERVRTKGEGERQMLVHNQEPDGMVQAWERGVDAGKD